MATWGFFPFSLQTVPYQSLDKSTAYKYGSNARVGERDSTQFLGIGEETIKLSGTLLPSVTGGRKLLELLKLQASSGKAWPLIERNGTIHGFYKCTSINDKSSIFEHTGAPHKIEFDITFKREDGELPTAALITGDIVNLLGV